VTSTNLTRWGLVSFPGKKNTDCGLPEMDDGFGILTTWVEKEMQYFYQWVEKKRYFWVK